MAHSNIFKPKMFDSRRKEIVGEEKRHQLHTPEKSQQPGYTCRKKDQVSFNSEDEDVPDGIPLKPVHHKRALNPRPPGQPEDRGNGGKHSHSSETPVGGSSQRRERLRNGAADVHRSRHSRGDPDRLPDEQRRLAKAIHDKELLIQEKLLRTAQSMRKMIIQDRESSETWSREPGRRRDADMRTEGSVSNPQEGLRDKWNTQEGKRVEKVLPRRPGRGEQPSDYGTRASGHLNRRAKEGMEVMELNSDKERSKRSIHLSAKMREESQWSQARANAEEEEQQGWERNSMGRHGSSGEEKQKMGQKWSVQGRSAEYHGGKERPHLLRSSRQQVEDPIPEEKTEASLQLLSCKYCDRRFAPSRLEKHLIICERLHQSQRTVFDSSKHRLQGTDMEKLRRNSSMSVSSEVKKSTGSQKQAANRNMHQVGPDQVTCPHCSRRFAPRAAERHIPKCENIRSRPPPPRYRQ
ncbi:unnamed protein product [Lota lota]